MHKGFSVPTQFTVGFSDFASETVDIELFCSQLSRNLWCLVTCWAPVRVEAERQPIIRTYWRSFVWCTTAKELHSLWRTIPLSQRFVITKVLCRLTHWRTDCWTGASNLCCRLTKEQKWQLIFDRSWRSLAPSSQTKWLVYLRKWKVTFCYPNDLMHVAELSQLRLCCVV